MVFWALFFPIILGALFKLAFGGITDSNKFEAINIAVSESAMTDQNFKSFLDAIEEGDYFKITKAENKEILDTNSDIRAFIEEKDMVFTKKSVILLASILASWIINFVITLIFIFYLDKVLGVEFGGKMPLLVLLYLVSSLAGVGLGILIGVSNKKTLEFKINLGIAISMLMGFLSGMMISSIKVIIQEKAPILGKINPISVVTDAIYSLYYYESTARFYQNIGILIIISLVFFLVSLFFMRGKEYESL